MGSVKNKKAVTDKKVLAAIAKCGDAEVRRALLSSNGNFMEKIIDAILHGSIGPLSAEIGEADMISVAFFRKHEKGFRELLKDYYDGMSARYEWVKAFGGEDTHYIDRDRLFGHLCFSCGSVDPLDVNSIVNISGVGIEGHAARDNCPSSTFFKRGLDEKAFTPADVVAFIDEHHEYTAYFTDLLIAYACPEFEAAISRYLAGAGLEDGIRYMILRAMLETTDPAALRRYTEMIAEKNYTRLKVMNDVMSSIGDYSAVVTAQEFIAVLHDAAVDNTEPYFAADFSHAYYFVATYKRVYPNRTTEFVKDIIARGSTRAKQAALYALRRNLDKFGLIRSVFESDLTLEDYSFINYAVSSESINKKDMPVVFDKLYGLLVGMGKINYHFKTDNDICFARDVCKNDVVRVMSGIAAALDSKEYAATIDAIYDKLGEDAQAAYLEKCRAITSLDTRACALKFLKTDNYVAVSFYNDSKIKLTYDEGVAVSDYLKSKKESVKEKIIKEIMKSGDCVKIAEYLVAAPEEYKKKAGEEILASKGSVSAKKLAESDKTRPWEYNKSVFEVKEPKGEIEDVLKLAKKVARPSLRCISYDRFVEFYEKIKAFRAEHADYEYETTSGMATLGSRFWRVAGASDEGEKFSSYPLGEEFEKIFDTLSEEELASVVMLAYCVDERCPEYFAVVYRGRDGDKISKYVAKLGRGCTADDEFCPIVALCKAAAKKYLSAERLASILYMYCAPAAAGERGGSQKYSYDVRLLFDGKKYYVRYPWEFFDMLRKKSREKSVAELMLYTDMLFYKKGFKDEPRLYTVAESFEAGIISEELARYLMTVIGNLRYIIDTIVRGGEWPKFAEMYARFIKDIIEFELKRGSLETQYTAVVARCGTIYGVEYFVKAIAALRGLTWDRSPEYGREKNSVFSGILKRSVKAADDSYEKFVSLAQEYKITKDELIRATVFNPEFVDYAAKYLGIEKLKLAVFWFVAHLNETLYGDEKEKREQQLKEFSDISYPDFQDGAFDYRWYNEMVELVPADELKRIYDNAKYVTVGGLHKRAQRFFDAVGGRIDKSECLEKINGTRNKDYCLVYSLIPVKDRDDLRERYAVLSEFLRGSKQFGAQRQLSERRTVDIAFENLARVAGYSDTDVFVFEMEAETPIDISTPITVDGVTVSPYIDENKFKVGYTAEKDGKKLASVPSKIGKDKAVVALRENLKEANKKFKRVIAAFERCMCTRATFTAEQLAVMAKERVTNTVLEKLFFLADGKLALCRDGGLCGLDGTPIAGGGILAHPVELKNAGLLDAAIGYVVKNNVKQPFKQALREIYTLADSEKNQDEVLRFKGFNVDLKKCVAALKGRGWGVSEDVGLRKVYYKSGVVAAIFRECDFFYDMDFTDLNRELHGIFFGKRSDGEIIMLRDVDAVTFSETLRDVDLMISVSSNTVYDFELAMSTVEVRHEILRSIVDILGLENVSLLKDNVKVVGSFGTYIINIRTGLVFKEGVGNLMIDTVYSVNKPLLLDFVDEDPMTADIISKTVVLANDENIRDAALLKQIKK